MLGIQTHVSRAEYDSIDALNITRLKHISKSPRHFRHALTQPPKSDAMTLGNAAHCAVLEPERFASDYVVWNRTTAGGKSAPRHGQYWEAFELENTGREILTPDQYSVACAIAAAIRGDSLAMRYLRDGSPEVGLQWEMRCSIEADVFEQPCKGRIDWLAQIDGRPHVVGIKTARDISLFPFSSQAAKLGYHMQWAWYHDGYENITGIRPRMVEIVVESPEPHDVIVYEIPDDVIEHGRESYLKLFKQYVSCANSASWPGVSEGREHIFSLPTWAYTLDGDEDLSDMNLETADE